MKLSAKSEINKVVTGCKGNVTLNYNQEQENIMKKLEDHIERKINQGLEII